MTTLREAAQQALEALEALQGGCTDSNDGTVEAITVWCPEVIDTLRAALEHTEQEPVSWRYHAEGRWLYVDKNPNFWQDKPDGKIQSLYAQQTTDFCTESKNAAILTLEPDAASN
jgi:hypothetical protein